MPFASVSSLRHHGPISGVAAHGDLIATAGYDNRLILWDAQTRAALSCASHDHLVNQCAFSADGRWLVSASSDYSARVWTVPGLKLHAVLAGHGDDVDMAVFSPDDLRIATCALDRVVRVFDRDGRCLHEMRGHTGNVLSLAWSRDGRRLVTSSVDGTLRVWDTDRGIELGMIDLQVRTDSVEMSPDGVIYAGDDRGRIAIIEDARVNFVQAHRAGVKKIALDARLGILISLSYDRSMAIWRIGGEQGLTLLSRCTTPVSIWARAAAVLDDGRVAVGTFGSTYALFDVNTGVWDVRGVAAGPAINAVLNVDDRIYSVGDAGVVSVDALPHATTGSLCNFLVASGDRVLTGGQLGQLFDADTGAVLYEHHSPLNCGVAFEREGQPLVAIGTYTGDLLVFHVQPDSGVSLLHGMRVYDNAIKSLSCSDGLLFSVCASTDIAWHLIEDWSLLRRLNKAHERIVNACCNVGAGQFATVGRDRSLRLWGATATEVFDSPHPNSVKCMAVNDERTALLTGSYGGTLAMFDLVNKRWSDFQRPTDAGISSIAWDGARHRFLAASYDGGIYPVRA